MGWKLNASRHYDAAARSYEELYGIEQSRKHTVALSLVEVSGEDLVLSLIHI